MSCQNCSSCFCSSSQHQECTFLSLLCSDASSSFPSHSAKAKSLPGFQDSHRLYSWLLCPVLQAQSWFLKPTQPTFHLLFPAQNAVPQASAGLPSFRFSAQMSPRKDFRCPIPNIILHVPVTSYFYPRFNFLNTYLPWHNTFLCWTYLFVYDQFSPLPPPPLRTALWEDRLWLVHCWLPSVAHKRCSINFCWMNE